MGTKVFGIVVACVALISGVYSIDLTNSNIHTVTDDSRYLSLHPGAKLDLFKKENYAKGNIIFTAGERIDGDRLILTYMDETQYTRDEDIEVSMWYPASGNNGFILSYIQIYADLSTTDAIAAFVSGGIGKTFAEILVACNKTSNFGYQIYIYGY